MMPTVRPCHGPEIVPRTSLLAKEQDIVRHPFCATVKHDIHGINLHDQSLGAPNNGSVRGICGSNICHGPPHGLDRLVPVELSYGDGRVVDVGDELVDGVLWALELGLGHCLYVLLGIAVVAEEVNIVLCGSLED